MNISMELNGRNLQVRDAIDDEARAFEADLLAQGAELLLPQSCEWLQACGRDFRLFQFTGRRGQPAGQVAVQLHRPRRASWYVHGVIPSLGRAFVDVAEERWALLTIPRILRETQGLSRLRLHLYHQHDSHLVRADELVRGVGFSLCAPLSYEKTLYYDLSPSTDELLARMDKKTRAKIRHRTREEVEIVPLSDPRWIPSMQSCLDAAFSRHGGSGCPAFDFEPYFSMAGSQPHRALILGLFLKGRPEELLAYSLDVRHGNLVEAVSSGSMPDPQLRKLHFNYFLLWDKVLWAKQHGANSLDLGGVTEGGDGDLLAPISAFKRHFTQDVRLVSREYVMTTRPGVDGLFRGLNLLKEVLSS